MSTEKMLSRKWLLDIVSQYKYIEIEQVREIVAQSNDFYISVNDAYLIWNRVSVCIDHHYSDQSPLLDLYELEMQLSQFCKNRENHHE